MNKQVVLSMLEAISSDDYFKEYHIGKTVPSILYKSNQGFKRVRFWYCNSFDLERNDLALEIQPYYEVRFNVLHQWFEKYSKRELKYQRDDDSIRFWGELLGTTDRFFFLENRKYYEEDLNRMRVDVIQQSKEIFSKYSSLNGCYDYLVGDVLKGERPLPSIGIEWFFERLILTKIVAPSNYDSVKRVFLQRIDEMIERNEPNVMMYCHDLPTILKDLDDVSFGQVSIEI